MPDMLNIGITGLNVAQAALSTSSHNIANASTPGYSRQSVVQTTAQSSYGGSAGYFGNGALVSTIQRSYNQFLENQVLATDTVRASLETYDSQMNQINNAVTNAQSALSTNLTDFFKSIDNMAANPSSVPARQAFLSNANTMVNKFQSMGSLLTEVSSSVEGGIRSSVDQINAYAQQLAMINNQITVAKAIGQGDDPNDLLDQRNQILENLNQQVKITTYAQSDGTVTVAVGNGQTLVSGAGTTKLVAMQDPLDAQRTILGLSTGSGASQLELSEDLLTGGALGGYLAFRRESLDPTKQAIGRIAVGVADLMNKQNQQGVDLDGKEGQALFSFGSGATTRSDLTVIAGASNVLASNAVNVALTDPSKVSTNPPPFTLSFSGGAYTLADSSGTTIGTNTSLSTLNTTLESTLGMAITLSSGKAMSSGDQFVIDPRPVNSLLPYSSSSVLAAPFNPITVTSASSNSVQANQLTVNITNTNNLELSDYKLEVKQGNFNLTRLSDNTIIGKGTDIPSMMSNLVNNLGHDAGFSIATSATLKEGDSFLIKPTSTAVDLMKASISDPRSVAVASSVVGKAATTNTGTGKISVTSTQGMQWSGAKAPLLSPAPTITYSSTANTTTVPASGAFTISYNGGTAVIPYNPSATGTVSLDLGVDAVSATPIPPATAATQALLKPLAGLKIQLSGIPGNGDTFALNPSLSGTADNANAVAMSNLQSFKALGNGGATFQGAYAQMVADIGVKANEVKVNLKTQTSLHDQALAQKESISGVNLDEEASNLIRYQQAYQAAARVMSTAQKLFDEVLSVAKGA